MDYELMGRQDYDKYAKAASKLQNFRITKRGALEKRPGFEIKATVAGTIHRIEGFSYTSDIGFILAFHYSGRGSQNTLSIFQDSQGQFPMAGSIDIPYTGDEIKELSLCQVGYIMFIAHRNHPPKRLRLTGAVSPAGGYQKGIFTLEDVNFVGREDPDRIPSITDAKCRRTQIARDQACGTMTEEYKVTAVYDGVETVPSASYSKSGVGSQAHEQASWSGDFRPEAWAGSTTTYYLPWTTSQNITLEISVPTDAEEARLYKKSFGVFGLIGVSNIAEGEVTTEKTFTSNKACLSAGGTVKKYTPSINMVNGNEYTLIIVSGGTEKTVKATASDWVCDFGEAGYGCIWTASADDKEGEVVAPNIDGKFNITRTYTNRVSGWTFVDKNFTPDTGITPPEPLDVFCKEEGNYPGTVCYSQQRLIWASTKNDPNRVWMSQVGDFYTYSPHERMVTDDPIDFELPIKDFPYIRHIKEMKDIIVFTDAAEWVIDSASTSAGITFETVRARAHGNIGSDKRLQPIPCNNILLFAERSGRAVRALSYSAAMDGIGSEDVSILSSSIFETNPIVDWAYQQFPYGELWCVLQDGTFASFTYMPEQKVAAWATHKISDDFFTKNNGYTGFEGVEGVASSRRLEGDRENIFVAVKRNNTHTIHKMGSGYADTYAVGQTSNDYPVESIFTSTYPAIAGDAIGLGQFDIKDLVNVGLRLGKGSVGGEIKCEGMPDATPEPIRYDDRPEEGGEGTLIGNIKPTMFNARDGRVTIKQAENAPFSLLMYEADYAVERSGQ
jgi:hypothetical protein